MQGLQLNTRTYRMRRERLAAISLSFALFLLRMWHPPRTLCVCVCVCVCVRACACVRATGPWPGLSRVIVQIKSCWVTSSHATRNINLPRRSEVFWTAALRSADLQKRQYFQIRSLPAPVVPWAPCLPQHTLISFPQFSDTGALKQTKAARRWYSAHDSRSTGSFLSSCLTDNCRPDAVPAFRRTPRVGEI